MYGFFEISLLMCHFLSCLLFGRYWPVRKTKISQSLLSSSDYCSPLLDRDLTHCTPLLPILGKLKKKLIISSQAYNVHYIVHQIIGLRIKWIANITHCLITQIDPARSSWRSFHHYGCNVRIGNNKKKTTVFS